MQRSGDLADLEAPYPSGSADPAGAAGGTLADLALDLAAVHTQVEVAFEHRLAVERQLRDVATGLHSVLDVDAVLSFGVAEIGNALGQRALVLRVEQHAPATVLAQWFVDGVPPIREDRGHDLPEQIRGLARRIADRYETFCLEDARSDPVIDAETRAYFACSGVYATISAAVRGPEDEVLLIAVHDVTSPRCWTDAQITLFDGIVHEITTALHNAAAFEQRRLALRTRLELDREKDEFISNVSHELRTPLTSVLGYLELLEDGDGGELNPEQRELTRVIGRNASRLLTLTEDLLLLSRVQTSDTPSAWDHVEVGELLAAVEETLRPQAEHRELLLTAAPTAPGMLVAGDGTELERAVLNVAANAVKFTRAGGRVRLDATADAGRVHLVVEDTGIGIPEQERARLFDRFFRGAAAHEHAVTGSGLGLAIAHRIVQRHGGTLTVDSVEGEGTTVRIVLPLAEPSREDVDGGRAHQLPVTSSLASSSRRSIVESSAVAMNGLVR